MSELPCESALHESGHREPRSGRSAVLMAGLMTGAAVAEEVDLLLMPVQSTVAVGDVVEVELHAVSATGGDEPVSAAEAIIAWDVEHLTLLGHHDDGAVELLSSGFPPDHPSGLNESSPPQDGIGMYMAWAPLGDPVAVTPAGVLLTTFEFEATSPAEAAAVDIAAFVGDPDDPDAKTIVFDGAAPNHDITGTLTGAAVTILDDCPADLTGDGAVGGADLGVLLSNWGDCADPGDCPGDLTGDGAVGGTDLGVLLSDWGACPGESAGR